jgi:hypothetical protein
VTQTFWIEPTDDTAVGLRTYTGADRSGWTCEDGWHDSSVTYTGRAPAIVDEQGIEHQQPPPEGEQDWPTTCARCGIDIPDPIHQHWSQRIWRRTDTGEERFNHSNPDVATADIPIAEPGACWNAHWMPSAVDGVYLMVRCPDGHDWAVDSRASNCGLPDDDEHRCWVRHGDPRECRVTVDKNGLTCPSGAGSIQTPNWHGFLRDGLLVE